MRYQPSLSGMMRVGCFLLAWVVGQELFVRGQAPKPREATWLWDLNVKARIGATGDWDKAKNFGIEVRKEETSGNLIYLCESGYQAVLPGGNVTKPAKVKAPTWMWAINLSARAVGNPDSGKARKFSVEVFKDEHNGNLVYLSETGAIAVVPGGTVAKPESSKNPTWLYDFDLKVRPFGIDDWDKARKYGVEVLKDENSGNLVYICETGTIAVIPGGNITKPAPSKGWTSFWDLDLKARPAGVEKWDKANKFPIEVCKDENSGNLVYIAETGSLAVIPGGSAAKAAKPKEPTWLGDLDLKVRPFGIDDWDKARKFGDEIFKDDNNGNLVFICETGSIAVVPGK